MMLSWDDVLKVELIDTSGDTDIIIADDLVSRGLARHKFVARKNKSNNYIHTRSQTVLLYM